MKHLLAAIIILLSIITSIYLCLRHTDIIAKEMLSSLELCENAVNSGNWKVAKMHIITATDSWSKNESFFSFFLHHEDLSKIKDLITQVEVIIDEKDEKMFKTENKRLMALVEDMRNMDTLTFENLF